MAPRQTVASQRNAIFRTKCTIKGKVCDFLIDNGYTESIISRSVVNALHLRTTKNPNPYKISWVKKGMKSLVFKICRVNFLDRESLHL